MSTIIMRVDLDCDRCYKKIRKVLCKLQDRENIKSISYDEKSSTVTVSGSFDAEEVSDRLCSDAGKVITDIQVARGNQIMKPGAAKAAPKQPGNGKESHGHGHGHGSHVHGNSHGGGGGKPDKTKHVKFDMDDDHEGINKHAHHGQAQAQGHGHGHGHGQANKPRVVTTTAMSRMEGPHAQAPASMTAMAPMRMPMPAPMPGMTMMPQATAAPSIWPPPPAAPEWGYSAPAYGGPPGGGYYGAPAYDHGGYGPYGGQGRYPPYQPQYYEEPSAGCSVM